MVLHNVQIILTHLETILTTPSQCITDVRQYLEVLGNNDVKLILLHLM